MIKQCKICHQSFDTKIYIDGILKNCTSRSYCWDCNQFGHRLCTQLATNEMGRKCFKCQEIKPVSDFYVSIKRNQPMFQSYCKLCNAENKKIVLRLFKIQCLEYKGSKCSICGYDKCPAALDFHHKNPEDKLFNICKAKNKIFNDTIKKELDKCDLLCSNCHRELEYNSSD